MAAKRKAKSGGTSKKTAKKALARQWGDVFFVVELPDGKPGTLACEAELAPTFDAFWQQTAEYIQVELQWWCHDHGFDAAEALERVRPALFHLARTGLLTPVANQSSYAQVRKSSKRGSRRFLFCDLRLGADAVAEELGGRLRQVLGKAPRLRFARP